MTTVGGSISNSASVRAKKELKFQTESQRQIYLLSSSLSLLSSTTSQATTCCNGLTRRAAHLDSLTSPASDASAALTQASSNLTATLALLKDAGEKFDTVADCEPAVERLYRGALEALDVRTGGNGTVGTVTGGEASKRPGMGLFNVPNYDNQSIVDFANKRRALANQQSTTAGFNDNASLISMRLGDDDTITFGGGTTIAGPVITLTEQDVYAAADNMEIVRDSYAFFQTRPHWKSTPSALGGLERVHKQGVDGMCILVQSHFLGSGPGIRYRRRMYRRGGGGADDATVGTRGDATIATTGTLAAQTQVNIHQEETAADTRARLSAALQIRDLMRAVGEYEEHLPLDTRAVRELRAIFECLGGDGCFLTPSVNTKINNLKKFQIEANNLKRSEKIGSGYFSNLAKEELKTGYPHLDMYANARRKVVYQSMENYYQKLKGERRRAFAAVKTTSVQETGAAEATGLDAAARDCVRCMEHAMVVVSGEKSIYRCVVSPTAAHNHEDSKVPQEYKQALAAAYSYVVSTAVDRLMDVIELFFIKDAELRHSPPTSTSQASTTGSLNTDNDSTDPSNKAKIPSVRFAASAAAASLRILDGVRMLGPSLSRLCELQSSSRGGNSNASKTHDAPSLASSLCIAIHRSVVKSGARALETLNSAIKHDPLDGERHRPRDARVAAVSSNAVKAIRVISPFVNAYKSVTKRRPLPWDPKIGDAAGDIEFFIRQLVKVLLTNIQEKAKKYQADKSQSSNLDIAKSYLFMMNNTFYILEQLGPRDANTLQTSFLDEDFEGSDFKITEAWFENQVNKLFNGSKKFYLGYWSALEKHLQLIPSADLQYQNVEQKLLNLESGRLIKERFRNFNEEFESTYAVHKELTVIDRNLRVQLLEDVKNAFLPKYSEFYYEYSQIKFSKKNMDDYLKYPPKRVESMMADMFSSG